MPTRKRQSVTHGFAGFAAGQPWRATLGWHATDPHAVTVDLGGAHWLIGYDLLSGDFPSQPGADAEVTRNVLWVALTLRSPTRPDGATVRLPHLEVRRFLRATRRPRRHALRALDITAELHAVLEGRAR